MSTAPFGVIEGWSADTSTLCTAAARQTQNCIAGTMGASVNGPSLGYQFLSRGQETVDFRGGFDQTDIQTAGRCIRHIKVAEIRRDAP